jgi:peptidoglycan/LPS O-acetylase OafA/YrhL
MQPGRQRSSGLTYRPEIDGLRAISVVSVVLFHAEFAGFGGGFVGVDVFFVISGFLITRILIEENLAGNFSPARFYERRARRILPALYVVVAACFAAALYLMLPSGLTEFSGSAIAALLFASNLYFWRYNDYFGPSAAEEPLIHTWSLGVEEQYYLLFPVLILFLWRLGIGRVAALIAAATLASLAFSEVLWRHFPEMNFYLLPSRAWQIGVGSLGAFLWHRTGGVPVPRRVGEAAAALGLALVAASVLLLDAGTPTPSLAGAGPVVGAVLVLLFATRGTMTGRLLALRPMVWIGLASYSAYLWHQPLFAFTRLATDEALSIGTSLALCMLTFLLAWATLVLVERPFRNRAFLTRRQVFVGAASGTLVLLAGAGTVLQSGGLKATYPPYLQDAVTMNGRQQGFYVRRAYNDAAKHANFVEDGKPRLLVIGDSYSQDFYNMIRETGAFAGYEIVVRYIQARCQIYLGPEDVTRFIDPDDRAFCAEEARAADMVGIARQADVVIFAASWGEWAAERLPTTLESFGFRPEQTVLVIGRKDFARLNRPLVAGASARDLPAMRAEPPREGLAVVQEMRECLPDTVLIDPYEILCPGGTCPLFTPGGELISADGAHLTKAGATYVGAKLFADPDLARFAATARRAEAWSPAAARRPDPPRVPRL